MILLRQHLTAVSNMTMLILMASFWDNLGKLLPECISLPLVDFVQQEISEIVVTTNGTLKTCKELVRALHDL